jgi:5-methylcytosine-specific restriction endonuclease McrA
MPDLDPALRQLVRLRAAGLCEYCLISETFTLAEHEVDHIIAIKHGGETVSQNLALCCTLCNRHKGSDISSIDPESGRLTPLFNPRLDRWNDHYQLQSGEILPLTAVGRVTLRLLRLNRPQRIRERRLFQASMTR